MKRTPIRKKSIVKNNEWYRKKACELAKKIVRHQSGYRCAYCGMGEPNRRTDGSHVYAEGKHHNMSADLDNILCLCWIHHGASVYVKPKDFSWHNYPAESLDWFKEKYPARYSSLHDRTRQNYQVDFKKKLEELKLIWSNIK